MPSITEIERVIKVRMEESRRLLDIQKKLKAGGRLSIEEAAWAADMVAATGGAMGLLDYPVSASVCQKVIGVGARRMYDYRKEGLPFESTNAYRLPTVVQWIIERHRAALQKGEVLDPEVTDGQL